MLNNFSKLRKEKKMSMYAVAKKTGITYKVIIGIEKGADLRVSTAYKIAVALNVSIKDLFID